MSNERTSATARILIRTAVIAAALAPVPMAGAAPIPTNFA